MSMYGLVFGQGERGHPLLVLLGFEKTSDVGRYRDAWLEDVREASPEVPVRVAVYTRNGGGNRRHYAEACEWVGTGCPACAMAPDGLPSHPLYLFDSDDSVDSTYATVYFRPPAEALGALLELIEAEPEAYAVVDTGARWLAALKALEG